MTFSVLNLGGRDKEQHFPQGAGSPEDSGHPPVNYHAYAACLHGGFYRDVRAVPQGPVLVLLRTRNLRRVLADLETLRKRGCRVFISCKESGSHQIADLLGDVTRWELFQQICRASDGAISSTQELVPIYLAAGCPRAEFLPTPYPVEEWDFSQPLEKRRGIFVGTREFATPSRNHLAAVVLADEMSRALSCPLAVVNAEGRRSGMILKSLRKQNPLLFIVEAPVPYADYLRVMALHRIVWQLDASAVPGQVAGDCLLCRMPCVGGNGAIESIAFPQFSTAPREEAAAMARSLLTDDAAWLRETAAARELANQHLSFAAGALRLQAFFASAGGGT